MRLTQHLRHHRGAHLVAVLCCVALALAPFVERAHAGQGCPFEDASCQTYCNQQSCNLGYCGHFAWIQCICRKCGDEWNWYDKVHYNPNQQVNQTELDSLRLNGSAPIIVTSAGGGGGGGGALSEPNSSSPPPFKPAEVVAQASGKRPAAAASGKGATLTTLLIPDLSDASKLDLNDIPDENSEKFLDYLARNHEKLAQATGRQPVAPPNGEPNEDDEDNADDGADDDDDQQQQAEETVEIQISSSNNKPSDDAARAAGQASTSASTSAPPLEDDTRPAGGGGGQVTRILRMIVRGD